MKKGDIVIIVLMVLLIIAGGTYTLVQGIGSLNKTVIITQNQEVLYKIKMNDQYEKVLKIEDGDHYNEVHIKDGKVWIELSNCNNQVCVYEKPIDKVGQVIVCLPHKLIIEIKGNQESEVDIISE